LKILLINSNDRRFYTGQGMGRLLASERNSGHWSYSYLWVSRELEEQILVRIGEGNWNLFAKSD